MATSGSFIASGAYGSATISWTATQNYETYTSSVAITMKISATMMQTTLQGTSLSVYINGAPYATTIYSQPMASANISSMMPVTIGPAYIEVPHKDNGEASFELVFAAVIGGGIVNNKQAFNLDPLYGASSVSSTSGYIGEAISITIASPSDQLTHTLTYAFAQLSGTIAVKTNQSKVNWVLPETFFGVMTNEKSKVGIITCETFAGDKSLGTTTCQFTAIIKDILAPILTGLIINKSTEHVALTGSSDILIKNESMVEYQFIDMAQASSKIVSRTLTCGPITITDQQYGVIDDVPSGTFVFTAKDSRGLISIETVEKQIIDYLRPTCNQEVSTELEGETGARVKLRIFGNYFNNTFGAVDNTLKVEVRHTQLDGSMGDWVELTTFTDVKYDGNTYSLELEVSGFDYTQSIVFQSRVTDKLHTVISNQYTVKVTPVYDWGKEDFNVNVPFHMNGETVLRHNITANNLVVSSTGGNIYLRPGGTSDTNGEVRIFNNGNVEIKGDLIINGVNITAALEAAGII